MGSRYSVSSTVLILLMLAGLTGCADPSPKAGPQPAGTLDATEILWDEWGTPSTPTTAPTSTG